MLGLDGGRSSTSGDLGRLGARGAQILAGRRAIAAGHECGDQARRRPRSTAPRSSATSADVLGRAWTLGTLQMDVAMPQRFGLRYIGPRRAGAPHAGDAAPRRARARSSVSSRSTSSITGRRPAAVARAGPGGRVLPITDKTPRATAAKVQERRCSATPGVRAELDDRNGEARLQDPRGRSCRRCLIMLVDRRPGAVRQRHGDSSSPPDGRRPLLGSGVIELDAFRSTEHRRATFARGAQGDVALRTDVSPRAGGTAYR